MLSSVGRGREDGSYSSRYIILTSPKLLEISSPLNKAADIQMAQFLQPLFPGRAGFFLPLFELSNDQITPAPHFQL